jgi:hypothetical protein
MDKIINTKVKNKKYLLISTYIYFYSFLNFSNTITYIYVYKRMIKHKKVKSIIIINIYYDILKLISQKKK